MFSIQFQLRPDEVSYMFVVVNASVISHLTLNYSGSIDRLMWIEENKYWKTIWSAPTDQCDTPSFCGPYGVCNPNNDFVCGCPKGFHPTNPATWNLRDGSGGCVRNNSVDCMTDGFALLSGTKLPDTSNSTVDMSLSLQQCRQKCLNNCSCTAYASSNISSGFGCLIWTDNLTDIKVFSNGGQDLYIRLAAADLAWRHHSKNLRAKPLSQEQSGHCCWKPCFCHRRSGRSCLLRLLEVEKATDGARRRNKKPSNTVGSVSHSNRGAATKDDDGEVDLPTYDFETICAATENFSYHNMLGKGGFGIVYKGKLLDGREIAVKRLSMTSIQGISEFKNEVMLIAKLQHRNLVRLLGCSVAGEERILVYEYMPNKSLDAFLFEKDKGCNLSWQARYNIITGIARGLLYLHQDSRYRIIHRDLKASNILLDNELNSKISDFGLARIFSDDDATNMTRKVVGTYGYMSPEYALNGLFSVKSDAFSFGVLVLEIVSGVRNKGVYHSKPKDYLLGNAWSLWNDGRSLELIDPLIGNEFPIPEVLRCIKVGLLCVQEHPEDRPTMSNVLIMLVSDNMMLPQPKHPGFVAKGDDMDSQSSSSSYKQEFGSINYVTLTTPIGR